MAENCDDGNTIDNDGCTNCAIDDDHTCTRSPASSPDTCSHKCGNGILDPIGSYSENCDDSNTVSSDGCTSSCNLEDDYTCPTPGAACVHKCGNGVLDPAGSYTEICDDGNLNNNDGCSSSCVVEDAFTCTGGSISNSDTCTGRCGNGALDPTGTHTEACDDGNTDNNDGCSSTCTVEDGFTCSRTGSSSSTPDSCTSLCGNGALETVNLYVEECDDGNLVNSDGCTNCQIDDSHTCT